MKWLAAALGVAALVAFVWSSAGSTHRPNAGASWHPIGGRPTPGPALAGTRPVTFHGLTIFVPGSWATNAVRCGAPLRDTVFFGDAAEPACGSIGGSQFSKATLLTWQPGISDRRLDRSSLTIDGHHATLGTGAVDGEHLTELIVPDLKARLWMTSPSRTVGPQLVRTAQITQTDVNGCPSTMAYVDLTAPATSGPSDVMVAGTPSAVVICTYLQNFLERGVALSTTNGTRLVDALNALPTGLSEASPEYYSPSVCRGGRLARQGDFSDLQEYAIRISYAHHPSSIVYARLGLCGALGFTNGTRTGQRITSVTELLVELSGFNTGWQGGVHPRG